jgi:diguanylate cyclase (GGDEF)-like protein
MTAWTFSDKRKLIAVLAVLLGCGFAASTLVSYQVSKASVRESIVASELPLTSDNLYSEIQKDLIRPIFVSSMMASDTFVRDWVLAGEKDDGNMVRYLREVKQRYGAFTSFFVSDRTRTYYQTEGVLKKVAESEPRDAWYFRVRDMQAPYEINVDPDLANKDALTIFINFRVLDYEGRFIGVTGIGLTVDAVRKLITDYQKRYQRSIFFVDRKGGIALFGSDARVLGGSDARAPGGNIRDLEGIGGIAERILAEGAGTFEYRRAGHTHFLNVRFIQELNWYLLVDRDEDEALAGIRSTLYLNLLICVLITAIVLFATSLTINRYQKRLEDMATTDKLTGLANRQAFDLLMPQAISEALRGGEPLLAMLVDIDDFKAVNDRHGHLAGDTVLKEVARIVKAELRASDIVCRWGGEEFLLVLKRTGMDQGTTLAERIRASVGAERFRHEGIEIRVTVSAGLAAYAEGEAPDALIERADRALYEAKAAGRDRVRTA